jgi:hypothetical protein
MGSTGEPMRELGKRLLTLGFGLLFPLLYFPMLLFFALQDHFKDMHKCLWEED